MSCWRESSQTRSNASASLSASFARISSASPEQATEVLHPLEVRDGDAAGVREDVRQHEDAALGEDRVRLDRGRAVGALRDESRMDAAGVVLGHLILARRQHEDVARQLEQLGVRDVARVGVAVQRSVLADPAWRRRRGRARLRRGRRPPRPRPRRRRAPRAASSVRRDPADVAEALHDAALVGERPAEPRRTRARSTITTPAPGRLVPEDRAADRDGLAGHDLRARRSRSASSTCPSSTPSSARSWPCPAPGCPPAVR